MNIACWRMMRQHFFAQNLSDKRTEYAKCLEKSVFLWYNIIMICSCGKTIRCLHDAHDAARIDMYLRGER